LVDKNLQKHRKNETFVRNNELQKNSNDSPLTSSLSTFNKEKPTAVLDKSIQEKYVLQQEIEQVMDEKVTKDHNIYFLTTNDRITVRKCSVNTAYFFLKEKVDTFYVKYLNGQYCNMRFSTLCFLSI
jgi:deoxycytidine triphosphate deaminase